ncbi:TonB family protein [Hymenobacter busanensis]|nr:M56 family metallopeptidase [Hymenobacter busanensis]QHJ08556.1 TonB family protein [Hymenobacter busanensis]
MTTINLLNWMGQSTLFLGVCWLFYRLVLYRERSFQFNRGILLLAPLLAATLPLLPLNWFNSATALPTLPTTWLPATWLPEVRVGGVPAAAAPLPWSWLGLMYAGGVLVSLLHPVRGLGQLWWMSRGLPRQPQSGYTLRLTGGRLPISSFGRNVYWDETAPLTPAEAAQVLRHEVAHVQQGHSADCLWLNCWQAVLWFNPFVYLHGRALRLTHEYLADAAAAYPAAAPTVYSALLARLAVAQFAAAPPPAHSFSTSQTLNRIAMLSSRTPVRRWKQWLVLPLLSLLVGTAACEKAEPLTPPSAPAAQETPAPAPGKERVYGFAERMPEYAGGLQQLMRDLGAQIKYPTAARQAHVEGKVYVHFTIDSQGQMRDIHVQKGVRTSPDKQWMADEMNQAALLAVRNLPGRWTAGSQNKRPVSVGCTVPVSFALPWQAAKLGLFPALNPSDKNC